MDHSFENYLRDSRNRMDLEAQVHRDRQLEAELERQRQANPFSGAGSDFAVAILVFAGIAVGFLQFVSWWGPWGWWLVGLVVGLYLLVKCVKAIVWIVRHPGRFVASILFTTGLLVFTFYALAWLTRSFEKPTAPAASAIPRASKPAPRKAQPKPVKRKQQASAAKLEQPPAVTGAKPPEP